MLSLTYEVHHFSLEGVEGCGLGGTEKTVFLHVIGQVSASNYWQRQDLSVLLVVIIALTFNIVLKDHFDCPGVSIYGITVVNDGEKGVGGR